MVSASHLVNFVVTIALLIGAAHSLLIPPASDDAANNSVTPIEPRASHKKPIYVIAHKVLTENGVDVALRHGANALEMDLNAWNEGWWADHDHKPHSRHRDARDLFKHVAKRRREGKNVQFVWLDIKNPDYCDLDDKKWVVCSIKGLRKLAREILEPAGVKVLYGFMHSGGKAFKHVRDHLNANEAINYDGSPKKTPAETNRDLINVKVHQKVASYGDDYLRQGFGNCHEASWYTCTELRKAGHTGSWGKIFGWTVSVGQADLVEKLFSGAHVDGIIYGFKGTIYYDHADTRAAAKSVLGWIHKHPNVKVADNNDPSPWSGRH
ncbi:MAG: hypothetical protein Q9167_007363 [Letrouitia subvulpina]